MIMKIIKKVILKIYHIMQCHYWSFRVLVWLKELGITRRINFFVMCCNGRQKKICTNEMERCQNFYEENRERIVSMMDILSDEKSKIVWEKVMDYRRMRCPIPRGLYSEHDQYFCRDIIKLCDGEVFVDGGAYTGDTLQQFMDTCKKENVHYKRIIAFEPDKRNFALISKFYGKRKDIMLIKKGLYRKEAVLSFKEEGMNSQLNESGECKVDVINVDAISECRDATFIKMDIEGAEMDALYGAQETIMRNRPKLAICIYHSNEDMIQIVEYIHSLVPEYKFYIRHHSKSAVETVAYAVIDKERNAV